MPFDPETIELDHRDDAVAVMIEHAGQHYALAVINEDGIRLVGALPPDLPIRTAQVDALDGDPTWRLFADDDHGNPLTPSGHMIGGR